jgi:sulfoacetaldehyde acetyltransferase
MWTKRCNLLEQWKKLQQQFKQSCEDQKKGITTFIEVILNQELGEPFRRDAMKKPVKVAGINKADMKKQPSLNS